MQSFGVWKRRPILNHSDHCASADGCMISFQVDEISLATEMCKVHIISRQSVSLMRTRSFKPSLRIEMKKSPSCARIFSTIMKLMMTNGLKERNDRT